MHTLPRSSSHKSDSESVYIHDNIPIEHHVDLPLLSRTPSLASLASIRSVASFRSQTVTSVAQKSFPWLSKVCLIPAVIALLIVPIIWFSLPSQSFHYDLVTTHLNDFFVFEQQHYQLPSTSLSSIHQDQLSTLLSHKSLQSLLQENASSSSSSTTTSPTTTTPPSSPSVPLTPSIKAASSPTTPESLIQIQSISAPAVAQSPPNTFDPNYTPWSRPEHIPTSSSSSHPHIIRSPSLAFDSHGAFNVAAQALPPNHRGYRFAIVSREVNSIPNYAKRAKTHSNAESCFAEFIPQFLIQDQLDQPYVNLSKINPVDLQRYNIAQNFITPHHHQAAASESTTSVENVTYTPTFPDDIPLGSLYVSGWELRCVTPIQNHDENVRIDPRVMSVRTPSYKIRSGVQDTRLYYDKCGNLMALYARMNDDLYNGPSNNAFCNFVQGFDRLLTTLPTSSIQHESCLNYDTKLPRGILTDVGTYRVEKNYGVLPYVGFHQVMHLHQFFDNLQTFLSHDDDTNNNNNGIDNQYDYNAYLPSATATATAQSSSSPSSSAVELRQKLFPTVDTHHAVVSQTMTTSTYDISPKSLHFSNWQSFSDFQQRVLDPFFAPTNQPNDVTLIRQYSPLHIIRQGLVDTAHRVKDNQYELVDSVHSLSSCLAQYGAAIGTQQVGHIYTGQTIHGTSLPVLLRVPQDDVVLPPYSLNPQLHPLDLRTGSLYTPQINTTNNTALNGFRYIYMAVVNEITPDSTCSIGRVYHPVLVFYDAVTLETLAVRPIVVNANGQCGGPQCVTGFGSDCHASCCFTYVHQLFSLSAPTHYFRRDLPHASVLPQVYTLDSQFMLSVNADDSHNLLYELDIRAAWDQRFQCNDKPIWQLYGVDKLS